MESLVMMVALILFVLLLLGLATLGLSLLARLGKVPPVIGYVALGIQGAVTIFAFLISPTLLIPAVLVLAGCILLQFLPKSSKK